MKPEKAILHRKNSLFYKTRKGAQMGDLFMSLIHTCELNAANPFDYLTELQRHAEQLKQKPSEWMPWNYRGRLSSGGTSRLFLGKRKFAPCLRPQSCDLSLSK